MSKWLAIAVVPFVFTSGPAQAQNKGGGAAAKAAVEETTAGADGVQYKKKTVYDFDDDLVEGDLARPDQEFVGVRKQAKHSSLIKIREHFIPEMLKSAEDV